MTTEKSAAVKAPTLPAPFILQRKCACGGSIKTEGECEECKKKTASLRRQPNGAGAPSAIPPVVRQALHSPGQPLDSGTRFSMEARFGHDFGGVRVHTDSLGAASADAVQARAYTVGNDVVFARGQYAPRTEPGMRLLAHELTHVAQQRASGASGVATAPIAVGPANDAAEREAEDIANRISLGQPLRSLGPESSQTLGVLRRQPSTDDQPEKKPPPWIPLPHPLDSFDPKIFIPGLGGGSLEDLHKVLTPPSSDKPKNTTCAPGWRMLKTGLCCPQYSVNPEQCCPPIRLNALGRCCPTDEYADGVTCVKSNVTIPVTPPGGPPPVNPDPGRPSPGGEVRLRLPSLPRAPLTVSLPIYFLQNRPGTAVADDKALRSSFAPGGAEAFDGIAAWLQRGPEFSVQLTGKASSEGPPGHNRELGEFRARSVANALILRGISATRITDPPLLPAGCPGFSEGLHNCGDTGAAKPLDEKDRRVDAVLFIAPTPPAKRTLP